MMGDADLEFELRGRPIVPGLGEGRALVSKKPLSFLGGIDPETGVITERGHDLKGKSVKGTVLCFPHGHGSTVGSYVLYSLVKREMGPCAIVNVTADPVVIVGAVIAEIPMVDRIEIGRIKTGALVEVNGDAGTVKVVRDEVCT
jgi:hypothetical protein